MVFRSLDHLSTYAGAVTAGLEPTALRFVAH